MAKTHPTCYAAVLVGGGPAGLAVLLNAHRDGILPDLLQRGLLLVERSATLGSGQIGDYVINSDSTGVTFLDPLQASREPALQRILETPVAKRIAAAAQGAVPLHDVGALMVLIGDAMRTIFRHYPQSRIITNCTAHSARAVGDDKWRLNVTYQTGETQEFTSPRLVLATGASQPGSRLREERVAGHRVQARWGNRLKQSGEVLTQAGLETVGELLRGKRNPKVAILGGSTSAVAVAHAFLHRLPSVTFGNAAITLFHRKPLRVYYPTTAQALADGYTDFGPDDLCPVSQRVFRFAGLRLDSRELLMQIVGVGNRAPEPRVVLHSLNTEHDAAVEHIDAADLVVAALGYRPHALPLFDRANRAIALFAQTGPAASLVDEGCRVLQADGAPLPGVYGIGLAAGYRPRGEFGGEPSFTGQANGLWLWQNGIGSIIARALLTAPEAAPAADSLPMLRARNRTQGTTPFAVLGVA